MLKKCHPFSPYMVRHLFEKVASCPGISQAAILDLQDELRGLRSACGNSTIFTDWIIVSPDSVVFPVWGRSGQVSLYIYISSYHNIGGTTFSPPTCCSLSGISHNVWHRTRTTKFKILMTFHTIRMADESLSREDVKENQLEELRLRYNGLCNIINVADHFFRHPIGALLVTGLLIVCFNIYRVIGLPTCPIGKDLLIVIYIILVVSVLIPSAYLHHKVNTIFLRHSFHCLF